MGPLMSPLAGRRYLKMNGLGNEIVVVDLRGQKGEIAPAEARAVAGRAESRFDQLMAVHDPASPGTDARLLIYNTDGSRSAACGSAPHEASGSHRAGTHVMPDGSVMSDDQMAGTGASVPQHGPTAAAGMICSDETAQAVQRTFAHAPAALVDLAPELAAGGRQVDVEGAAVAGVRHPHQQAAGLEFVQQPGHGPGVEVGGAGQVGDAGGAHRQFLDGDVLAEGQVMAGSGQFPLHPRPHGVPELPEQQAQGGTAAFGDGGWLVHGAAF